MWKCIFDETTNVGTGFNREPQAGEYAVDIAPSECGWFNATPGRYFMAGGPSGVFTERPGWAAEVAAKELADSKAEVVLKIVAREDVESWKKFQYMGHDMKVTEAVSRTTARFKGLSDSDPVPTLGGFWNDFYENPVAMTMGDLRGLENGIYDRAMYNYGVRMYHTGAVNALTSIEEVQAYDFSTNWQ